MYSFLASADRRRSKGDGSRYYYGSIRYSLGGVVLFLRIYGNGAGGHAIYYSRQGVRAGYLVRKERYLLGRRLCGLCRHHSRRSRCSDLRVDRIHEGRSDVMGGAYRGE